MASPDEERKGPASTSGTDGANLPKEKENGNADQYADGEVAYLTGLRLFLVMTGVTLTMFLAMLDIAIIGTVCSTPSFPAGLSGL